MKKMLAFTVAEVLIALTIIGAISVIMLINTRKAMPDKNKAMFKKAYSVTERVVGELINDDSLYPYDEEYPGFFNTDPVEYNGVTYSGRTKFCRLFESKLNIAGTPVNNDDGCSFTTSDGISWFVPEFSGYLGNSDTFERVIVVDVNGNKKPNLGNFTSCSSTCNTYSGFPGKYFDGSAYNNPNRDRLSIVVKYDGTISVVGNLEQQFIKSQDLNKEKNISFNDADSTSGGALRPSGHASSGTPQKNACGWLDWIAGKCGSAKVTPYQPDSSYTGCLANTGGGYNPSYGSWSGSSIPDSWRNQSWSGYGSGWNSGRTCGWNSGRTCGWNCGYNSKWNSGKNCGTNGSNSNGNGSYNNDSGCNLPAPPCPVNGSTSSGCTKNGCTSNGCTSNGCTKNGCTSNGTGSNNNDPDCNLPSPPCSANGSASSGCSKNGCTSNGTGSSGCTKNGCNSNGTGSSGCTKNGCNSNGKSPNNGSSHNVPDCNLPAPCSANGGSASH